MHKQLTWALLLDTRSIQKYIFAGNLLRSHVGASYLVEQIFEDLLIKKVLNEKLNFQVDNVSWKNVALKNQSLSSNKSATSVCEIGYIGGGNALVLFEEQEAAIQAVRLWSREILTYAPGLKTGAAIGQLDISDANYKSTLQKIRNNLKINQSSVFPNLDLPSTGLTIECANSGDTANTYYAGKYISAESRQKLESYPPAKAKLQAQGRLPEILLNGKYQFTDEIDKLGQIEGDDYIAIVHIDGNNMGKAFADCETLNSYRQLSCQVAQTTWFAFEKLLESIVAEYSTYISGAKPAFQLRENILPIRPIIIGGDDITFVCAGKLGLEYARRFIGFMTTSSILKIECCAGIALLPTSYPFFRGYELAEQLCAEAKKQSRADNNSSWLDFAILHGEQAPTLEQIRATEYKGALGNMHFGPYKLGAGFTQPNSLDVLLLGAENLKSMPSSTVKELRFALAKGEHEIKRFKELLSTRQKTSPNSKLPNIPILKDYEEKLWLNGQTPYTDMIEIMDFIPPCKEEANNEV